jgi:hypothetical protein
MGTDLLAQCFGRLQDSVTSLERLRDNDNFNLWLCVALQACIKAMVFWPPCYQDISEDNTNALLSTRFQPFATAIVWNSNSSMSHLVPRKIEHA